MLELLHRKGEKMLLEEIDNMVWSGKEKEITGWCNRNKVYDEITDNEIEEIWERKTQDDGEAVRLNGKYVWETAKRVCDFINAHEDIITITTFGEYRDVMRKVTNVIREANNVERRRRQTSRKKKEVGTKAVTQRAKSLIASVKGGRMSKDDIERSPEAIFGKGSSKEIAEATTNQKIVERIEEMSKREVQFEEWEKMRREKKQRQRQDRRLNEFWRKNKTFPAQFDGEDETPGTEETLEFWKGINNKEVSAGWKTGTSVESSTKRGKGQREEGSADGSSSQKPSSKRSSDALPRGRHVVLTACIPSRSKVPNHQKSSVSIGKEDGRMEDNGPMGRCEQLTVGRQDDPDLQRRRQERPGKLPPHHLPSDHHQDDHACHPQADAAISVWKRRKMHPGV